MNFNIDIVAVAISLVTLFLSITVHEFSHAWAAYRLGDDTAKRLGRLTLNPIAHMDPVGTIMILVSSISGFGIGWGKPVPYNPHRLRVDPRSGGGLVAVAGPVSNLLLAVLVALPLRFLPVRETSDLLWRVLKSLAQINIWLAVFNLLPIFPLDGHRVLLGALTAVRSPWAEKAADGWERIQRVGPTLLMLVIILDSSMNVLGKVLAPPAVTLCSWIFGPGMCWQILAS